jgi:diguanylate cyclase (GGDEF)-like protein
VISIKKYLDMTAAPAPEVRPESTGPVSGLVQAYSSTIAAMGSNGARACPPVGAALQQGLAKLQHRLEEGELSPLVIQEIEKGASEQLAGWSGRVAEYFKSKTAEVKELLITLAGTAESMGQRDLRYSAQFGEFTRQLEAIADLEDLGQVRTALVQKAADLKGCLDRMAAENREAVVQLKANVSQYESRLKEAETLVGKDGLTGLFNRRGMEQRIEAAIADKKPFCVVMLDLNRFKQVNDTHGHQAGDSLLTQFAQELRSNIRSADLAGRWGGDEFVLLLACDMEGARAQIERIEKWVFGEYTLPLGTGREPLKLEVRASVGVAEWRRGETSAQLIERADRDMYQKKKLARKQHA